MELKQVNSRGSGMLLPACLCQLSEKPPAVTGSEKPPAVTVPEKQPALRGIGPLMAQTSSSSATMSETDTQRTENNRRPASRIPPKSTSPQR